MRAQLQHPLPDSKAPFSHQIAAFSLLSAVMAASAERFVSSRAAVDLLMGCGLAALAVHSVQGYDVLAVRAANRTCDVHFASRPLAKLAGYTSGEVRIGRQTPLL